jgi:UDP-GlcNAc:undecaprenyl-phosphate GlcNAc-1-phosphate transferase
MISGGLVPLVRRLAFRVGAVDRPGDPRRIHNRPIARLGGLAIFAAFILTVLVQFNLSRELIGLLAGISILFTVGLIDDVKGLSPRTKLIWQVVAAGAALAGGIGIYQLSNPFGGVITLDWGRFGVTLGPLDFHITPIANLISLVWMVGMINVINFLDGLDGLATGISAICSLVIFLLSLSPTVNQPEVALLAIILTGACLGFLPANFYPARIFLGDSGAYILGLTLALLAIYSGGKLATALLVLGFTIIDGIWTVIRRVYNRVSPFKADRLHLHHLLLDIGLSQRQAVLGLYVFASAFGLIAILSGTQAKFISLIVLLLITVSVLIALNRLSGRRR